MGRIFSQSQGKFVDVPDTQSAAPVVSSGSGAYTPTAGDTGQSSDVFKKIAIMDLLKTGGKNLAAVKAAQDLISPSSNADQKKQQTSFNATTNLLDLMEQRFQQAGGGEYSGSGARIAGLLKGAKANLGLDAPAKIYEDQRKGFAATLKQLTGDTGVLTDQDYARLSSLIPSLGATPEEAQAKFNDLRSQVAAKFGGSVAPTKYQAPESKGGALAALLPGLSDKTTELQQQTRDYQKMPSAGGATKLLYESSPLSLITNPKSRAATGDIASVMGLLQGAGAIKKGLSTLTEKGALANRATAIENAASGGVKFSGKDLYSKAEDFALKNASETDLPKVKNLLETVKATLADSRTPQEAIDKLTSYNKAYSSAGKVGKTAKAVVDDALSKATRELLKEQAPELATAQSKLATALKLKKVGGSIGRQVIGTGVGIGAGGLLGWLLGKKNSQ